MMREDNRRPIIAKMIIKSKTMDDPIHGRVDGGSGRSPNICSQVQAPGLRLRNSLRRVFFCGKCQILVKMPASCVEGSMLIITSNPILAVIFLKLGPDIGRKFVCIGDELCR